MAVAVRRHRFLRTMVEVVFAAAGAAALLVILIAACVCCSRRTAPRRRKRPHNPMHYYGDTSSAYRGRAQNTLLTLTASPLARRLLVVLACC